MSNQILPPLTLITLAPGTPEPRPTPMAGDVTGSTLSSTVVKVEGNLFEPVTYGANQDGYALTWINGSAEWQAKPIPIGFSAGGDLVGTPTNQTVTKLQGNPVISAALSSLQDGYALTWVNSNGEWTPKPVTTLFPNIGDGYACAVGLNASGAPVRVTDPSCVSGLHFIGDCDNFGKITAHARKAEQYNIEDFGAVPNDSSITARIANTNAFKIIQTSLGTDPVYPYSPRGAKVVLGPFKYYMEADPSNTTACIHVTHPLNIQGHGSRYQPTTELMIPDGVIGIKFYHGGASGAQVHGIYFNAEGQTSLAAHGISTLTDIDVSHCVIANFGGHGIYWDPSGFPDYVTVSNTYLYQNQDGIHINGGSDTSGAVLTMVDAQFNRGWGIYDHAFLGTNKIGCTTAENMRGGFTSVHAIGGVSVGNYAEGDQPPTVLGGFCEFDLGGTNGSGYSTGSSFFGGPDFGEMHATGFTGKAYVSELTATGSAPEQITLGGQLTSTSISVRIEITQDGYPGGYDSFHPGASTPNQQILHLRWSIDGGSTWTAAIPGRADNWYVYGPSSVVLGTSGLTAYLVPYYYPIDSVYTTTGSGGNSTRFWAGSNDGTLSVMGWEHLVGPKTISKDSAGWSMIYDSATGIWKVRWANSNMFSGFGYVGGRARPGPGEVLHTSDFWLGREYDGFLRIGKANADYALGSSAWRSSALAINQCYEAGSLVVNTSKTNKYPHAWVAKQDGGWASTNYGQDTVWFASMGAQPGQSVVPTVANGYVYQCKTIGTTGAGLTEPVWPVVLKQTVVDGGITWECFGTLGSPFESLTAIEPYTPTSSADTHGLVGDTCQDANYFYYKNAAGWRRASAVTTFNTGNDAMNLFANTVAIGPDNTTIASGQDSFAVGLDSQATSTYSISIGAHCRSTSAASVAIGESCQATFPNTVCIGWSSQATATYAAAIGSYVYASGASSFVCGSNTSATRSGEFAHGSSAVTAGQGGHAIDLGAVLTGADGYLKQSDGIDFTLPSYSALSMKIRFLASTVNRSKIATETHELLLTAGIPAATILSHDTVWMPTGQTFAAQGWSITIDTTASGSMRILVHPGTDTIRVIARLEWAELQVLV